MITAKEAKELYWKQIRNDNEQLVSDIENSIKAACSKKERRIEIPVPEEAVEDIRALLWLHDYLVEYDKGIMVIKW